MRSLFLCALVVSLNLIASPFAEDFTYDDLDRYVRQHPELRRLDEILALLPKNFRSAYTLMHRSHGLQDAGPEAPRAIVYGADARFLIAFDAKGKTLEMIQFRDRTATFDFHRFHFEAGGIKISETNPAECLSCHGGKDPRPNWEQYSQWPGAYGADHDSLTNETPELKKALADFLKTADSHPLYRNLVDLKGGFVQPGGTTWQQHNEDLNQRVFMLNLRRVSRRLRAMPLYPKFKYALVGLLECRKEFLSFIPDAQRAAFSDFGAKVKEVRENLGAQNSTGADAVVPFLESLKQPAEYLSTNFLTTYQGFSTPGVPDAEFLAFWVREDADLAPFFRVDDSEYRGAYAPNANFIGTCDDLRAASLRAWR